MIDLKTLDEELNQYVREMGAYVARAREASEGGA